MLTQTVKTILARTGFKGIVTAGILGLAPTAAFAGHHDIAIDLDLRHGRPHVEIHQIEAPPPPACEQREVRVWVEPVYRTVADRQWIEPEYRTVVDRVWVPDQFEVRDVVRWDRGRRVVYRDRVLVQPGHYAETQRQELVCEGHWQNVDRQELVTPGHWETHLENVPVADAPLPPRY